MAYKYEAFGKRLTKLLNDSGHNQKELAQYLKVSTASTSMWCMGKTFPRPDKQKEIASFLGITVSELIGDNELKDNKIDIDKTNDIFKRIIERVIDEQFSNIINKYAELDEDGQKDAENYIDYLLDKKKR